MLVPSAGVPARRPGRWLTAAALPALALAAALWWNAGRPPASDGVPLVAVLPFATLAKEEGALRLADGLTGDVISDLARFPEFEVLASGATEAWRGRAVDPREVAGALGQPSWSRGRWTGRTRGCA